MDDCRHCACGWAGPPSPATRAAFITQDRATPSSAAHDGTHTGAGEDHGIDHHKNCLRFPYDFTLFAIPLSPPAPVHRCIKPPSVRNPQPAQATVHLACCPQRPMGLQQRWSRSRRRGPQPLWRSHLGSDGPWTGTLRRTTCVAANVSATGAGVDNGIGHNKNRLRFPYDSTLLRPHALHPHPHSTTSPPSHGSKRTCAVAHARIPAMSLASVASPTSG
jgi:hypothetical protein